LERLPGQRKVTEYVTCVRIAERVVGAKEMREHILCHHSEKVELLLVLLTGHMRWASEYWSAFKD